MKMYKKMKMKKHIHCTEVHHQRWWTSPEYWFTC